MINKINKSFGNMTEAEKDYIVDVYFSHKDKKTSELREYLGISQRAMLSVFKERNIASKRKNRYRLNEHYFENIDTPAKAYFLGLIYADGYLGEPGIDNLSLSLNDHHILKAFAKELEYDGEIKKTKKGGYENSKEGFRINFSSTIMANDLRRHGLYSNKSLTLSRIPSINKNLKRDFLRGYFDGDGSVVFSRNTRVFKEKTYEYKKLTINLIATHEMIQDIVNTFNIKSYHVVDSKTSGLAYLQICKKAIVIELYNLMYQDADVFLDRKYQKWTESLSALELKDSRKIG